MPPPDKLPTDIIRTEGRIVDYVTVPPVVDGVAPISGVFSIPTGIESLTALGESTFSVASPREGSSAGMFSSPGLFSSVEDYMTGGNGHHNEEVDALITRAAIRIIEEERGVTLGMGERAQVRRYVHDLLPEYKQNVGRQRNGNVDPADFPEILDHTVSHFGVRDRGSGVRAIESSEDMHWRIEQLIEHEMMRPENAALWSDPNVETIRATLRTRLRSEFSGMLMNEWGSERLEDISDFLRSGIVADFEERAARTITDGLASSMVCAPEPAPAPIPTVAVAPTAGAWSEVATRPVSVSAIRTALNGVDPVLADFFNREIANEASPVTTVSELLTRISAVDPAILDQAAAAATAEGRPLTEMTERGIFELITRAAGSRGSWTMADATRLPELSGRFERSLRATSEASGEAGRVEGRERDLRREAERRGEHAR